MADDRGKLDKFLNQVDEIESIVKGLARGDDHEVKAAMSKADSMLADISKKSNKKFPSRDNTGENRTVINQKAFKDDSGPQDAQTVDQGAFMEAMQKDADERYQRKKKAEKEATVLKEKGNGEFKAGNYEKAIEFYTQGLEKIRDMIALYTNRAQAFIKIGKYEEALSDCDWALRVSDKCIKAYVHQGRAYLGLKEYDKAIESYRKVTEVDPTKENMVQDYIAEVKLASETASQESNARHVFAKGDTHAKGVIDILNKINKTGQLPLYYSGGFRILIDLLKTSNERTLFRTHGGLQLMKTHPMLSRCFGEVPRNLSRDEIDACTSAVDMLTAACKDNAENSRQLLEIEEFPDHLQKFLSATLKKGAQLREAAVTLLHTLTLNDLSRSKVVASFNMPKLLSSLFLGLKIDGAKSASTMAVLNNLTLDKKFKVQLRGGVEDLALSFENLLEEGTSDVNVLPYCISVMINLCGDTPIRSALTSRTQLFEACCSCLNTYQPKVNEKSGQEVIYACLGLLMNLTFDPSQNAEDFGLRICKSCRTLMQCNNADVKNRNVALLGHILPKSKAAVEFACSNDTVTRLLDLAQEGDEGIQKNAVKCLATCTQHSTSAREQIISHENGLKTLVGLLKHNDEGVLGNAALCLSHCSLLDGVCRRLTKTNIIMHLLVLARDGRRPALQQNCAILIARLAQGHTAHLERLRELDGHGILHDCMKYIK